MNSLGHSSFPPTALGRQEDVEATPGVKSLQTLKQRSLVELSFTGISLRKTITEFFGILTKLTGGAYRLLSLRDNH
ncbi:hypothetical protein TNCV_4593721 [Trichonephila clavipes]|uniref:Uncharacterized protein n=1 Tax=Trichonephila clavipes TaxID=2585209 RepID=A0A8X7BJM0_TRICX|nr:hypothetical protein TNCV_4593721 [Trichonephila clavipes]